jgi:hypothetical protein
MKMRFMMMMIPRVYQPDTPPGDKAGEGFAPPAEAVDVQKAADNPTVQAQIEQHKTS